MGTPHRTRNGPRLVLGLLLLASAVLGGGCSASPKASRDAGTDCVDAGDGWCRVPCKRSVADYCAGVAQAGGACVTQWPADPGDFCSLYPPDGFFIIDDNVADSCGGYRAFYVGQVEGNGARNYYSMQTGKLLAVFASDPLSSTVKCLGGPPDFVEPGCNYRPLACGDAGTDAGTDASGSGGTSDGG